MTQLIEDTTDDQILTIDKEIDFIYTVLAEKKLVEFVKQTWHILEPKTMYIHGWHIDAICDYLEAVTLGQIKRLIINIPPRHMKSLLVSVFWPCWTWIRKPETRYLYSSYASDLSTRDSLKCRHLIDSMWYKRRWGDNFRLLPDQNQKNRFENDKTGYRLATSVGGSNTGEGADILVEDDPNNIKDIESDVIRNEVNRWESEVMSSRYNNPRTGAKVIVQQRSNENDVTGYVLSKNRNYTVLCLPARYEGNKVKTTVMMNGEIFKDPRTTLGERLWPEQFDEEALLDLEREAGSYAWAGQYQQNPSPRGGGMFKVDKFKAIEGFDRSKILLSVRGWDKAGTEGGGAYSAGVLMHKMEDKTYVVEDVIRGQWSSGERELRIKNTSVIDGHDVIITIEQEPGSGGKESAESTIRNLAGFEAFIDKVSESKAVRAKPYSIQVEWGNVFVLNREWTQDFKNEHEKFPMGKYKDQVDATTVAFNKLNMSDDISQLQKNKRMESVFEVFKRRSLSSGEQMTKDLLGIDLMKK